MSENQIEPSFESSSEPESGLTAKFVMPAEMWPADVETFLVERRSDALSILELGGIPSESLVSLFVSVLEDQASVLTDPGSARFLGRVLDDGHLEFTQVLESLSDEESVRTFFRISRSRLLREDRDGIAATRLAKDWVDQWLSTAVPSPRLI